MHAAHAGGYGSGYGSYAGGYGQAPRMGGGAMGGYQQLPGGYHHQQQWYGGGGHYGAGRGKAQLATQFMSEGLRQLQNRNYLIQSQVRMGGLAVGVLGLAFSSSRVFRQLLQNRNYLIQSQVRMGGLAVGVLVLFFPVLGLCCCRTGTT